MIPSLTGRRVAEGRFVVGELLAGAPSAGLYAASSDTEGPALLSSVATHADPTALQARLQAAGGAELLWSGRHQDGDFQLFLAIERQPPGQPLADLLRFPSATAEVARTLLSLAQLAERLASQGVAMGVHPRTIFCHDEDVAYAWRLYTLLDHRSGEWNRPILEPTLEAPERLNGRGDPRTPASVVFSLCALGAWMASGKPPFGETLLAEARAHFGGPETALPLASELAPVLGPGLRRNPGERPTLSLLAQQLDSVLHPVESPALLALKDWQEKRLSETGLFRICSSQSWKCPASLGPAGLVPRLRDGWLRLYTSSAALETEEKTPIFLEMPGPALFAGLPPELKGVELAAGTPAALKLTALERLRRWGQIQGVEAVLEGRSSAPLRLLRDFEGWWIVMRELPDGRTQLAMAPDPRGRRLAAVFTAEDCRDAYVQVNAAALGPRPLLLPLHGQELFERLAAMPIDGIVFNCLGPVPPRAVARELAEQVLKG